MQVITLLYIDTGFNIILNKVCHAVKMLPSFFTCLTLPVFLSTLFTASLEPFFTAGQFD